MHGKYVQYAKNSLGLLTNKNPLRIALVWLVTWNVFDNFIMFLIMINSLSLGIKVYTDPDNETLTN